MFTTMQILEVNSKIQKELSGLQREYLRSRVNMLANHAKILDITNRDIFRLYFPRSYE